MIPDRYTLSNLRRIAENPRVVAGELNRLGREFNRTYHDRFGRPPDTDVMAEDWDNLFLLDGCRYDVYRDRASFDEPVERRLSAGSDSREFIEANFAGRELHDTVYVTANPHAYRIEDGVFHYRRNLLDDEWDPDLGTVRPEVVADAARDAHERFPDKRLLVHFMQPHFPFIGERGRELDQTGIDLHLDDAERSDGLDVWEQLRYGYLDAESVWEAYRENLDVVLETVRPLVEDLAGKTVVSSDHGNLIGDRLRPLPTRGFGHPRGLYVAPLLAVPWQVLPSPDRRTVRASAPVARDDDRPSENEIDDRLRNLGYLP